MGMRSEPWARTPLAGLGPPLRGLPPAARCSLFFFAHETFRSCSPAASSESNELSRVRAHTELSARSAPASVRRLCDRVRCSGLRRMIRS